MIYLDCDGVILDLHGRWMDAYNQKMGTAFKSSDIHDWGFTGMDINKEVLFSLLWDETLYDHIKVIEGALDGVRFLRMLGHRIVFATSSTPVTARSKMDALSRFGFLTGKGLERFRDVVIVHDKSLLKSDPEDIMVDDHAGNFDGFRGEKILFDQPHNRALVANGFTRCLNWQEVVKAIVKLGG